VTYWLINLPFLAAAALVALAALATRRVPKAAVWLVGAGVMLVLTAVFDNAIIGFGIVDYDDALISGVRIGVAPIEDFAYTAAALMMIPTAWHLLERRARGDSR
jgi:lycopene cyclase domain-containing protein